jgi:hypothetical protein
MDAAPFTKFMSEEWKCLGDSFETVESRSVEKPSLGATAIGIAIPSWRFERSGYRVKNLNWSAARLYEAIDDPKETIAGCVK